MRAVAPASRGGESLPRLVDQPEPAFGDDEVLVEVRAAGVNRADLLQLRGLYPPPAGESEVPGLEASGLILQTGAGVSGWNPGDRVMALVAGGAQAQRVAVPAGQLMPLPRNWSFEEGAALPEAAITSWTNLVKEGRLEEGEWVLVSGATGGVGTYAVPLARALGAKVVATARDPRRIGRLAERGAAYALPEVPDMRDRLAKQGIDGVDLVLELVGGRATAAHLAALNPGGRLALVGVVGGTKAEIDLGRLLRLRLRLVGSTLRSRSRAEKAELIAAFRQFAEPRFTRGELRPVVGQAFKLDDVARAYRAVAQGGITGKTVLTLS